MQTPQRPRVGIVSDCPLQRHQIQSAVTELGYPVTCCREPQRMLLEDTLPAQVDIWVLLPKDEQLWEELTDRFLDQDDVPVLYAEDTLPQRQSSEYPIWRRRLQIKIEKLLGDPEPLQPDGGANNIGETEKAPATPIKQSTPRALPMPHYLQPTAPGSPCESVVVLAASLGGPTAVKAFLDCLPANLPVGFLYAQHIDDQAAQVLVRVLGRDGSYPLAEARAGERLRTGEVTLIPIMGQLVFDDQGKVRLPGTEWPGPYNPSIDQVMLNVGDFFRARARIILFSGMGEDGARAAPILKAYGASIWAQDTQSCANSSMPDSVAATGCVDFRGPPEALAEKLLKSLESEALINRRSDLQDNAL